MCAGVADAAIRRSAYTLPSDSHSHSFPVREWEEEGIRRVTYSAPHDSRATSSLDTQDSARNFEQHEKQNQTHERKPQPRFTRHAKPCHPRAANTVYLLRTRRHARLERPRGERQLLQRGQLVLRRRARRPRGERHPRLPGVGRGQECRPKYCAAGHRPDHHPGRRLLLHRHGGQ